MARVGALQSDIKDLITRNSAELSGVVGNLLSAAGGREIKTVVITSCYPLEGKTTAAISMAYALAAVAHSKVLLVEANLRSPKLHEAFDTDAAPGLSDFFLLNSATADTIRQTEYQGLSIMPCGTNIPSKADILTAGSFGARIDSLKQAFDYIIFDGGPFVSSSENTQLLRLFDAIIFVIECEKTKWEVVQDSKEKITNAGGKVLGAVLNKRRYHIPQRLYGKL